MRVLVVGAGGVGSSAALIAARRDFFESWLIADYDLDPCPGPRGPDRRPPVQPRPGSTPATPTRWPTCAARTAITHVLNAVDPRYVLSIFQGAFLAGAHYMDTAMSLSPPASRAAVRACPA